MAGRSIATQQLWLQKETTPGTPVVTAMKKVLGLKVTPGWGVEFDSYQPSGSKVPSTAVPNTETGDHQVDTILDFNAMLWVLTGLFGAPTASTGVTDAVGDATTHAFALDPDAADALCTFTAVWGDSTQALQAAHFFFNSVGITVEAGMGSLTTSAMSYKPTTGATLPSSGTSIIPTIPIARRHWNIYIDDAWADLGTTKLLALYRANFTGPDKYSPDYVINSAKSSFDSVIENDGFNPTLELLAGLDAASVGLIGDWADGTQKFIRLEAVGPVIDATSAPADINAELTVDMCVRITNPGQIEASPAGAVAVPLTCQIELDSVSGNAMAASLTNLVTALA